jgi:acetolactate synthase-1/2/3 large subunit
MKGVASTPGSDITAVLAKHEFSAGTMADRYGGGRTALSVLATSGGGALNRVAVLGESLTSGGPGADAGRPNFVLG